MNIVERAVAESCLVLKVKMFTYASALKAPDPDVIKCEDNVVETFASLASCSNHLYLGED